MVKEFEKVGPMQVRMLRDDSKGKKMSEHFGIPEERADEIIDVMNEHMFEVTFMDDLEALGDLFKSREEEAFGATIQALTTGSRIVPDRSKTENEIREMAHRIAERMKQHSPEEGEMATTSEIVKIVLKSVENDEEFKLGVWYLLPMLFVEVEPNAQAG